MSSIDLRHGDCRAVLRRLAPNSLDACVTDPPYGLAFMGQAWDYAVPGVEYWRAVLRVLKPGAHLLCFGGSRTFHRIAVAIEDAGFELRDTIMWVYGQGFPKSLDVSKALDRRKEWAALPKLQAAVLAARKRIGISQSEAARRCGLIDPNESLGGGGFMWFETGRRIPTRKQYVKLKRALQLDDSCDLAFEAAERAIIGQHADGSAPGGFGDHRFSFSSRDITAPATVAARRWDGFGTALKPAFEPIIVARKPLAGTVAGNVIEFGTGALNIDGCRVATDGEDFGDPSRFLSADKNLNDGWQRPHKADADRMAGRAAERFDRLAKGRWPANVILSDDPEVQGAFPAKAGACAPASGPSLRSVNTSVARGKFNGLDGPPAFHNDSGSAARFFYCAKASRSERAGSKHPTVKPIALMRYLVRLVTPPRGKVLDCFAGSGSTGEAALREGFDAVLIERERAFVRDIRRRIVRAAKIEAKPSQAKPSRKDTGASSSARSRETPDRAARITRLNGNVGKRGRAPLAV